MNRLDGLCQQEERDLDPGLCPVCELGTNDVGFHFLNNGGDLHRISVRSKVGTVEVENLEKDIRQNERHADDGDHPPEE